MTALIHKHSQPFDSEKIAPFVARKMGLTTQDVLEMWRKENLLSTTKGTHVHAIAENLWQGREYEYDKNEVLEKFGYDAIEPLWEKSKDIMYKFYNDFKDRLIPIGCEQIIGNDYYSICGSIDFLAYSKKLKSLVIIDYKTNKSINFEPYKGQKMTGCLSNLDDCNFIHYSLQLNGYQYILEKETGLKLSNQHYLVWVNENNDNYIIYQTKDLLREAEMMLDNYVLERKELQNGN